MVDVAYAMEVRSPQSQKTPRNVQKWGGASVGLEASCVTLAKGTHVRASPRVRSDGLRLTSAQRKAYHEIDTRRTVYNCVAKLSADAGQLNKAERWMMKLDGSAACTPEVGSFNAVISEALRLKDVDKAEQWFAKVAEKGLHPELKGLEPNLESYNVMITACAEMGDIPRAEKYVAQAEANTFSRPSLRCLCAVVRACIKKGEPRRAHQWMESLVQYGCCDHKEGYSSKMVAAESGQFRSQRSWDVDAYISLIVELVQALAEAENTITAKKWLRYLAKSGVEYGHAPEAWEKVRDMHPQDIVPAVLSGEMEALKSPQSPALRRPARLTEETRGASKLPLQALEPAKSLQDRPTSQASTRPGTGPALGTLGNTGRMSSLSGWGACETPRSGGSRAASPALRYLLHVRSRGATPTLSRLGCSGGRDSRSGRAEIEEAPGSLRGQLSFDENC